MSENWTRLECELIVDDYFQMLIKELCDEAYNKAEFNRQSQLKLNSRTKGSVEYKHQNISAVLLKNGFTYINGYKPALNYQTLLEEVVIEKLEEYENQLENAEKKLLESTGGIVIPDIKKIEDIFVDPPEKNIDKYIRDNFVFKSRKIDFSEREQRNQKLGKNGEEFVLKCEEERLKFIGRDDLVKEIEWTSQVKGDGAGYDIRSFNGKTDDELFIEVKTTNAGKYQPFLITENEVRFSEYTSDFYSLYRVFEFSKRAKIFMLDGKVTEHVNIYPRLYRASF